MNVIGVTGVRSLERLDRAVVLDELWAVIRKASELHVGDASGIDYCAFELACEVPLNVHEYRAGGREPWQLQARSKRMVDELARREGTLHAYPNSPCPAGLHPQKCTSWLGSGTWGTVCYAASKGVKVVLHPLTAEAVEPEWMKTEQLTLL